MVFARLLLPLYIALSTPFAFAGEVEWKAHMDAGDSAYRAGDYRTAAVRLEAALREAESFGVNDLRVAATLSNLGHLLQSQARFTEAEQLYQRALGIAEKALGSDHRGVGTILNNLAVLYATQGR